MGTLRGLPMLLVGEAAVWWQGVKSSIASWSDALQRLRAMYGVPRPGYKIFRDVFRDEPTSEPADVFISKVRANISNLPLPYDVPELMKLDMVYGLLDRRILLRWRRHIPKAKHTTMAETPELKRIAENTKIQSNVKYHADFEKSKGKFTQVADDPETLRIKANTKIISNVAYHGELEKKAQMEKQRQINENGEIVELPSDNYHQQIDNYATEMLPPNMPPPNLPPKNHYQTPTTQYHPPPPQQQTVHHQQQQSVAHQQPQQPVHQPQQQAHQHNRQYQEQYYKPKEEYYPQYQEYQGQYYPQYQSYPAQQPPQQQTQQQKIGRIQDYDPISDGPRAPPNTQRASATLIYNSTSDGKRGSHQQQGHQQQQSRQIGRVTDLDPLANELPRQPANHHNQRVYVAMYDYEASDSDEVSFREGSLISLVSSIDSGWMTGQVLRTGRTGMLPANYVELTSGAPHYDN